MKLPHRDLRYGWQQSHSSWCYNARMPQRARQCTCISALCSGRVPGERYGTATCVAVDKMCNSGVAVARSHNCARCVCRGANTRVGRTSIRGANLQLSSCVAKATIGSPQHTSTSTAIATATIGTAATAAAIAAIVTAIARCTSQY